jgi:outer membrane lipoprotein
LAIAVAASLLAAGCVSVPQPLQGAFIPITPAEAIAGNHDGALVRWGGVIAHTEPLAERTCFEVVATRLDAEGEPSRPDSDSLGRFIACRTGFYDPVVFAPGRSVTFTGRLDGQREGKVGEYAYRFPVISADVVYLWPKREVTRVIERPTPWPWWGWW